MLKSPSNTPTIILLRNPGLPIWDRCIPLSNWSLPQSNKAVNHGLRGSCTLKEITIAINLFQMPPKTVSSTPQGTDAILWEMPRYTELQVLWLRSTWKSQWKSSTVPVARKVFMAGTTSGRHHAPKIVERGSWRTSGLSSWWGPHPQGLGTQWKMETTLKGSSEDLRPTGQHHLWPVLVSWKAGIWTWVPVVSKVHVFPPWPTVSPAY